jgi:hypothetical protein
MSFEKQPEPNQGFIYILSNVSMPGVYKVGLTTNSVRQRAQELASTGVPTEFHAERVFEIEERHLRAVEFHSHRKLKSKNFHQGKEFFRAPLELIVEIVEETIFEITLSKKQDLIGQAEQRISARKNRELIERLKKEHEELVRQVISQENMEGRRREQDKNEFTARALAEAEREAMERIRRIAMAQAGTTDQGDMPWYFTFLFIIIGPIIWLIAAIIGGPLLAIVVIILSGIWFFHTMTSKPSKFSVAFEQNLESLPKIKNDILQKKMEAFKPDHSVAIADLPSIKELRHAIALKGGEIAEAMAIISRITRQELVSENNPFVTSSATTRRDERQSEAVQTGQERAVVRRQPFQKKWLTCPVCRKSDFYILYQDLIKCTSCLLVNDKSTFQ